MLRSSPDASASGPQSSVARGSLDSAVRAAKLRAEICARLDRIRSLMVGAAPHGFQTEIAEIIQARRERISRELGGVQELTVKLFLAEVSLHREEGRPECADRLMSALNEGQPLRLSTGGAVVIRMADGQMYLDLS